MFQKISRRLSRADDDELAWRNKSSEDAEQRPHRDNLKEEADHGQATSHTISTPCASPIERSPTSTPKAGDAGRPSITAASRLPVDSSSTRKRVQWAPKNRVEHFEHVPLEEESDEESRAAEDRMRELDEHGTNPVALARLHQELEAYLLRSRRDRKEDELQLPRYISQSKSAPRSSNIKRLFNQRRKSSAASNLPPSQTRARASTGRSRAGSSSQQPPSSYEGFQGTDESAYGRRAGYRKERDERDVILNSDLGRQEQLYFQELRRQPVERYYDLGHCQLSSVPDVEPDMPLPSSSRAHEWAQRTQDVHEWAKRAQAVEPEASVDNAMIEERGEQERKKWENRAKRLVRAYSTSQKGPLPGFSRSSSNNEGQETTTNGPGNIQGTSPPSEPGGGIDIEAGQSLLNEPLPFGGQHGVLGTLLTLYRQPDLSRTSTSLGSTGDESTTSDVQNISLAAKDDHQRPTGQDTELKDETAHEIGEAGFPKKSVRGRRQTGLPLPHPSPSPQESLGSPESADGDIHPKTFRSPYRRLKKSLSAPGSILHLPLPARVAQPQIPASLASLSPAVPSIPSRSSGGVVAALIATSQNLMGPAAPSSNAIAPDLTKRGYALSRYEFSRRRRPPIIRTASQDASLRLSQEQQQHPNESPTANEDEQFYPRQETSETETMTDISPTRSVYPKEHDLSGHSERPSLLKTRHPSLGWIPNVLSRTSSRASSIFGDKDKEREDSTDNYLSSQVSLSGTDEEALLKRRIEKRLSKRVKREKRKMAQIYITRHIAEVLQRQEFIMKFGRAHLMFSGPSHRLQRQLQATARVLDLQVSTVHLPNVILMSFGDESTSTSMVKIIQQSSMLNLEKLSVMHDLFWKVIHDEISVSSASVALDLLMCSPPRYRTFQIVLIGGLSSSAICTLSFSGSFADALIVFPLGCLLVVVQTISLKHELYSNVFEISIATLLSFLSAALASSSVFCYAAIASSSVVLILPGFIVLTGSLELASKQIVSGAVRIGFAVIYSLFLGFGIAIGAQVFSRITHHQIVGPDDFLCRAAHQPTDPWWQRKPSLWWAFLTVPLYSFVLTIRNHAPMLKMETLVTVLISCGGWTANHFAGVAFHGRPDLQAAVGAFAVGTAANIYARLFRGNAYVVMITGILFQLPSGLANGGLLTFAERDDDAQMEDFSSFMAGFQVAIQLIAVAVGLTVGLFTSVVVVHPLGGSRKGANAVFSL